MYIFSTLLLIILIIIFLLAIVPLKVSFNANSAESVNFHFIASWLNPVLKGTIVKDYGGVLLKVYLFNSKVLARDLKTKSDSKGFLDKINFIKSLHPKFERLEASYGFEDPSITGMIYGALTLLSPYIKSDTLYNNPDFTMTDDYFYFDALFEINVFSLALTLFRYNKRSHMKVLYEGK
ncbi:DUF2953 domain-containing protein [Clostridium bovifaecis]|uniref:DUF2953 domain-containing protein n=1 Tax=Clostridium bovifaecis TaxID=2184719 RepID=A0A6I6F340_9CLOT|nr:DUF2953 domain-containing protein [Clostridium bovifaecis]